MDRILIALGGLAGGALLWALLGPSAAEPFDVVAGATTSEALAKKWQERLAEEGIPFQAVTYFSVVVVLVQASKKSRAEFITSTSYAGTPPASDAA